jgi:hypothetical protein
MRILVLLNLLGLSLFSTAQKITTRFEQSGGKQTPTYNEAIDWWKKLDAASPVVQMKEMGPTDAGYPLHLVVLSADRDFDIKSIKSKKKAVILVNNGIHPGEPDGIDASMVLARDIAENRYKLPSNVILALIPVYNIGGALNRSANYRVDQNGPEEFGFRGNSQNLDLNRDFIKNDSKEANTFATIFHYLDPDVFVDNHVSNGADYQHVMTLLTTQHNKLGGDLGEYLNKTFEPGIYASMKTMGWDLVPYVNHFGETPEKGWSEFWDSPRYSSGYAALWNTFAFVPETHMLKPYQQRVNATGDLMKAFIGFTSSHAAEMIRLRSEAKQQQLVQAMFPIAWKWDRSQSTEITFKGYEAGRRASEISGQPRLYYDRSKPFERKVPFYNVYRDTLTVQKPKAYIIPQGWWKVIDRLKANGVQMRKLTKDSTVEVECYRIENYQSGQRPFEGHHLNSNVQVSKKMKTISFRKGDWYIPMNQAANRFLIETLEPQGEDSYFAWNFFDPILGQKEGFSDYVFEETALDFLKKNPPVQKLLDERKASDSAFAKNGRAQLNFVFQHSPYYESAHLQYPVYRVIK